MDKLRIGMIGVRGRGGIARHWQASKRAVVVAGADVNEDHLQAFREEINPDAFITTDYREMLE
ncbi:MAG TPA: gfo/Idh/MocA family oxidoreductase, partial [Bacillota bacterium]|nr:gfo/Idh/MocA family oxidoreductase [Bacillota bacterium]